MPSTTIGVAPGWNSKAEHQTGHDPWDMFYMTTGIYIQEAFWERKLQVECTVFCYCQPSSFPHSNKHLGFFSGSAVLAVLLLMLLRVLEAFLAARAHCWLMLSLLPTKVLKSLFLSFFSFLGAMIWSKFSPKQLKEDKAALWKGISGKKNIEISIPEHPMRLLPDTDWSHFTIWHRRQKVAFYYPGESWFPYLLDWMNCWATFT